MSRRSSIALFYILKDGKEELVKGEKMEESSYTEHDEYDMGMEESTSEEVEALSVEVFGVSLGGSRSSYEEDKESVMRAKRRAANAQMLNPQLESSKKEAYLDMLENFPGYLSLSIGRCRRLQGYSIQLS